MGGVTPAGAVNPRFEDSSYGPSVDAAAWGDYVVSTGYGDLWSAINPDTYNNDGDPTTCDNEGKN